MDSNDKMDFKGRIAQLREERGMSVTALATEFGKTEAAVRAWETGRTKPDTDTLARIAMFFNCSTDYLLGINKVRNNEHLKEVNVIVDEIANHIATYGIQVEEIYTLVAGTMKMYTRLKKTKIQETYGNWYQSILQSAFVLMGNIAGAEKNGFTKETNNETINTFRESSGSIIMAMTGLAEETYKHINSFGGWDNIDKEKEKLEEFHKALSEDDD